MQIAGTIVAAALIGAYYGYAVAGALVGSLIVIGWQLSSVHRLEKFMATWNADYLKEGSGIWPRIFSRVNHLRRRGKFHKTQYRDLFREIRRSTNALPDAAIILNSDDEIVFANASAESLVGVHGRADRGRHVSNLIRHPQFIEYLKKGKFESGVEIPSAKVAEGWLYCQIVPYAGNQRLLLIRDITERRKMIEMRRDFVANASHELRTPLTVINGYVEAMVDDTAITENWRGPLQQMQQQANRMTNIVDELLELSRIETRGKLGLTDEVDVSQLLVSAKRTAMVANRVPNIGIEADEGLWLAGSRAEIESLVLNLVSNAVRHTPQEGMVTLSWQRRGEWAELRVNDSGEGIPEHLVPRLTERFFRVAEGRGRDNGGVGLGLAIVKHIVQRHGGELQITSKLGVGTSVTCRFPPGRIVGQPETAQQK